MRRRFFVDRFEANTAVLRDDGAHHLGRVLRAQPGQLYELSNGHEVWLARIERVEKNAVAFALVEQLPAPAPALRVKLLLAIVKFDRFEWALEKATELGVAEVVPVAAARSEKSLVAAARKRAARWGKILLESSQQSRRLQPPVLAQPMDAPQAFGGSDARSQPQCKEPQSVIANECRLLLSERVGAPSLKKVLTGRSAKCCTLAIGPEGGWTDEEFAAARAAGFEEVSLGENILRTETAVIAALAAVNFALAE